MSKLWQCHNCLNDKGSPGLDFTADKPVCPKCGLDATLPEYSGLGLVVKREVIHLDVPHKVLNNRGTGKRACDGKPIAGGVATGTAGVVNCEKCKATPAFKALADEQGLEYVVIEKADYVLSKDTMPVND